MVAARIFLSFIIASFLAGLTACQENQTPVERSAELSENHRASEGTVMGCQLCYDQVRSVRETMKGPNPGRPRAIKTHNCPDCSAQMKIYVDDKGVLMVRCPKCVPAGVPCDRCLPPKQG